MIAFNAHTDNTVSTAGEKVIYDGSNNKNKEQDIFFHEFSAHFREIYIDAENFIMKNVKSNHLFQITS